MFKILSIFVLSSVLSFNVSAEELPWRKAGNLDANGDGFVSEEEQLAFKEDRFNEKAGEDGILTADEVKNKEHFKRMDANGDGKVTSDEAKSIAQERFKKLDKNADGKIDKLERKQAKKAANKAREKKRLRKFDKNHDGKIDKKEAKRAKAAKKRNIEKRRDK